MASSVNGGAEGKTLKEGERVLAPTRRPDGTLRKEIRIRAGYRPPDEVPIYQSKGAIWKKELEATQDVPPGYNPEAETKSKSKAAKRNERKKEKRQQAAALDKDMNAPEEQNDFVPAVSISDRPEKVESVLPKMNGLTISSVLPPSDSIECSGTTEDQIQDIDKKIRALKKKIRLTEAQQQKASGKDMNAEQVEKLAKLEGWRDELKAMEDKKAELAVLS